MAEYFSEFFEASVLPWFVAHGGAIVAVALGAYIVHRLLHTIIERAVRKAVVADKYTSHEAEVKRENTLIAVFHNAAVTLLWIVVALIILSEAGINVGPMIAAAGIAGLAFGFGGQYLIRDLISGFFIILENQYRVGDVVCIGGTCGLVEAVTLRATTLRDLDGTVHHVPHGEVTTTANLTKVYSRVNLNIGVSYGAELEKVIGVVNRVGKALAEDPAWKDAVLKPPQFLRVDEFADSAVVIKILGDTKPLKQWDVTGELRRRLKIAFDKEGIEIPFPQRVIHTQGKK